MNLVERVHGVEEVEGRRQEVDQRHAGKMKGGAAGGGYWAEDIGRQDQRPLELLGDNRLAHAGLQLLKPDEIGAFTFEALSHR